MADDVCRLVRTAMGVGHRLTSACTRPATRCLSCSAKDVGGRVMRGVSWLQVCNEGGQNFSGLVLALRPPAPSRRSFCLGSMSGRSLSQAPWSGSSSTPFGILRGRTVVTA